MPYTVEIATPPIHVDGAEQAARMYQLPDPFGTVADAKDAAIAHIEALGLGPAPVLYTVFDREGFTVASNGDSPASAA
jgi:hypothetical protein